jgi:hypothetical protein
MSLIVALSDPSCKRKVKEVLERDDPLGDAYPPHFVTKWNEVVELALVGRNGLRFLTRISKERLHQMFYFKSAKPLPPRQ